MPIPAPDSAGWSRIAPYLDRALDLEPNEREAWFAELSATQPDIADQVRAMLAERDRLDAEEFLAHSPLDSTNVVARAGARVGAYVMDRLIGRGGMGEVWLARRCDGRFEGECAIKFLSGYSARAERAERFHREGRLLARLTHPNIARLLDAGTTGDGSPYLVLEYVQGEPIDRFCDHRALQLEARLRLFLDVLGAVTHAQNNLVVHRDLKPSNVLVTAEGVVKLLDFGIAKLLEDGTASSTHPPLTRDGAYLLTPEYAAPEQLTDAPLTTATDVYALGVLLYVLLTGRHPAGESARSPADMIKAIVETEPARMSWTAGRFNSELDTIVAKALKKIPAQRYGSAAAMADDIRRYLEHQPIRARPDAVTYRAAKFMRRNRLVVAAAVLILLSLITGLGMINHERVIAQRRFDQLRQLSGKVFELDTAIRDLPGSMHARRKLVAASLEYLEGLAADVRGDIDLAATLADAYWRVGRIQGVNVELNLGDRREAEQSLTQADAFIETVLASRPRSGDALFRATQIGHDRMILAEEEHRIADASSHARRAAERIEKLVSMDQVAEPQRTDVLSAYSNVGLVYLNMGMYDDAERATRRQLFLAQRTQRPENQRETRRLTANGLSVLANILRVQGDLPGALQAIREARSIAEGLDYANEMLRMKLLYAILSREGLILGEDGSISFNRPAEAIIPLQQAFDIAESIARRDPYDSASRTRLVAAGRELGDILRHSDPARALAVYDAAVGRLAELPITAKTLRDRAELLAGSSYALRNLHRADEARQRVDAAFAILEETKDIPAERIPPNNSPIYTVFLARADTDDAEGKTAEAIEIYRELLDKVALSTTDSRKDLRAAFKLTHLYRALASMYARTGNASQAAALEAQRLELLQAWEHKLPGNSAVRQLAVARVP